MNKQQMAEWLAETLFDKHSASHFDPQGRRVTIFFRDIKDKAEFFYSPDGFFAVWDAVIKKFPYLEIAFSVTTDKSLCYAFINHVDADPEREFNQFGKDRYEAFYNAVYEAMQRCLRGEE